MSRARLGGEWRRLLGTCKEWLGRWTGDESLRMRGERDRWLGRIEVSCAVLRRTPLLR
jgi:uncharacterized protein YjbJ (UPF0337 family)